MKGRITVTGANMVFLAFALIFFIWQVVLSFLSNIFGTDFVDKHLYGILTVNQLVAILLPVLVYALVKGLDIKREFRFNKLDGKAALIIILISVFANISASMFNSLVVFLLQFLGEIPRQPLSAPQNPFELASGIFMIAVVPAICEELLHRGLFLRAYESRGSIKAVVITAVFFGFFHFDITNFLGPVFLGLLIGYYVIKTDSIFAGMLAHFMNNALSEFYLYIYRNVPDQKEVTLSSQNMGSILVMGLISLAVIWMLIKVFDSVTEGKYRLKPSISGIRGDIAAVTTHWPVIVVFILYVVTAVLYLFTITFARNKGISY
ncbi:MAG: type II CAAX endopeptidase family protein [Clostridiales bacterium]|jgi:membrane protease YdiL (CAAX protease family)|nr:CPBP family intramembrane metalloprotease [Eubacteriales bacterium]MDH7565649.1 type II CAAX endopeptidase family protein [Clostridiales bacterium]